MSIDAVGITAGIGSSIILGLIIVGLTLFFCLRSIRSEVSTQAQNVRKDITEKLSSIDNKVTKIETLTNTVWDVLREREFGTTGTVEIQLKNFAKTTITAEPREEETAYIIQVEKGTLDDNFIAKVSNETRLNTIEREMFGKLVGQIPLRPNRMRLIIPSTDPKLCTKYISIFLKWLDLEYIKALPQKDEFETGIEV